MPYPVKGASREDFCHDAVFGMPGVPAVTGCLKIVERNGVEEFENEFSEYAYQIWRRGVLHGFLEVRDKLMQGIGIWADHGQDMPEDVGPELCEQWQKEEFLPKRPGD